jgi:hypothetical protein
MKQSQEDSKFKNDILKSLVDSLRQRDEQINVLIKTVVNNKR